MTEHAATSLGEIEKATLRLTAIRMYGSIGRAATRLGMAHVSLSRRVGRSHTQPPPMSICIGLRRKLHSTPIPELGR